jgi:hypothetical protein
MIPLAIAEARERTGAAGRAAMAGTNEDVVVLAIAPLAFPGRAKDSCLSP